MLQHRFHLRLAQHSRDCTGRTGWSTNASGGRLCGAGRKALRGHARSARSTRSLPQRTVTTFERHLNYSAPGLFTHLQS